MMDLPREKPQRPKDPLERKMDQWLETGRQFVDGVAGNRPGSRTKGRQRSNRINPNIDTVGRWVEDKIDWLLEEEDDWLEPWQEVNDLKISGKKQPLEAISRRVSPAISKRENNVPNNNGPDDEWPDEESFKIDRWKRQSPRNIQDDLIPKKIDSPKLSRQRRSLPKSNRQRN